jgi:16S rRNA (uracil1498-N3)-methyltransferase
LADRSLSIDDDQAHYLGRVLRLKVGDGVVVFNGMGEERTGVVETLERRRAALALGEHLLALPESSLAVTLIQALIKSDAMDLVIQKATELGVHTICAVKTDFSVVKLDETRSARRIEHWQKIAQGACEQSGRHRPPVIESHARLEDCFPRLPPTALRIAFDHEATTDLGTLVPPESTACLMCGPEGGFGPADQALMDRAGFVRARLGPRTLRAETAAISACALVQHCWGDLR